MAGVHSPSVFRPEDYSYLGVYYLGGNEDIAAEYHFEHSELEGKLLNLGHDDPWDVVDSRCDSCGTGFNHGAAYLHTPTHEVVSIGQICAGELWSHPDFDTKERHRKTRRAATRKMTRALREEGSEWLAENFADQMAIMEAFNNGELPKSKKLGFAYGVWADMVSSARRYGSLTDRQVEFANKLLVEVEEFLSYVELEAAEEKDPVPVTSERMLVTGTVLSVKWQDSPFAYNAGALKMLVKDERGFKVWGTVSKKFDRYESGMSGHYLGTVERGMKVRFEAKVERSEEDEYFGFFSRPTKAEYLEEVNA